MMRAGVNVLASKVAIGAVGAHAVLFLTLHALEPGLDPVASIISDYAQTESAPLVVAAFLAFAAVWGSLAVALSAPPSNAWLLAGRGLFALAAIAIVIAAVFPETADPRTGTAIARIQNLLARPGLFVGVLLVSWGLRRAPGWERLANWLLGMAFGAVALLGATIIVLLPSGVGGIGQRAVFVILYLWVWLIGRRIARSPKALGDVAPAKSR